MVGLEDGDSSRAMTPQAPPTLSVVTPARDMGAYLPEALDSVAALQSPHEHIVVDGGSGDGSVGMLSGRDDPALRWTSEPDRGQTHAVNKGFERARGDLVGWLNADDAYVPGAVDRAVAHLVATPEADAVFGGVEFVGDDGAPFRTHQPRPFSWRRCLFWGTYLPTPTIIFRRELLDRHGLLDEAYADAADYDFYLRLLHGSRMDLMPEPLVRFRYHAESKSTKDVWTQHDEALAIRLKWARGPLDRMLMRGYEGAKRAVLPRISSWPQPHPSGAVKLLRRS
jgi:glycosyltransferase involved in cell wall biosynthesis